MSTTAARKLVETLCCGEQAIPLLILHDFDKAAFTIASTSSGTRGAIALPKT